MKVRNRFLRWWVKGILYLILSLIIIFPIQLVITTTALAVPIVGLPLLIGLILVLPAIAGLIIEKVNQVIE